MKFSSIKIKEDNMIIKLLLIMIEVDMDLVKIHLINLKMIYLKIRVESTMKLIVLGQREKKKEMISPKKSILLSSNQQKVFPKSSNFSAKIPAKLAMVTVANRVQHQPVALHAVVQALQYFVKVP
jgi:hypothetical protein